MNNIEVLAHYDSLTGQKQALHMHLLNTVHIAAAMGKKIHMENICTLIALLHDVGKASQAFQNKLLANSKDKVIHSTAGAAFLYSYCNNEEYHAEQSTFQKFIEVCCYVIEAHHGLFDIIQEIEVDQISIPCNYIFARIEAFQQQEKNSASEVQVFINTTLSEAMQKQNISHFDILIKQAFAEYKQVHQKLSSIKSNPVEDPLEIAFYHSMLLRLLLSVLKTADVEDTVNAFGVCIEPVNEQQQNHLKNIYLKNIEDVYSAYAQSPEAKRPLNCVRNHIAEVAAHRGKKDGPGIYCFDVPTGAGKTKSALRYALWQMHEQNKDRFFYITAYLTVLEQNAKEIQDIIGTDGVLEHHSNVIEEIDYAEQENKEYSMQEYLLETWNSPVVLSTMVQFFNSLLKGKSANIRRFASLINSVIVLDEIQSLPATLTFISNLIFNFLKYVMHTTILLCTATQPLYDHECITYKLKYGNVAGRQKDIIQLTAEEKKIFHRAQASKLSKSPVNTLQVAQYALQQGSKSVLIVVNTKKCAKDIYDHLLAEGADASHCYYLSTNLCAAHRKDKIAEIKQKLALGESIYCVSTQLIEAGVDVDFDVVMRSYAGMDSIVQCMGRCNREGKKDVGVVKLICFDQQSENTSKLKSLHQKKFISAAMLNGQDEKSLNMEILSEQFYNLYFKKLEEQGKLMEYPMGENEGKDRDTLFQMLSRPTVRLGRSIRCIKNGQLYSDMKCAAVLFEFIENVSKSVFVYYGDGKQIIDELICLVDQKYISSENFMRIKQLLKQLQPYTVNLYTNSTFWKYVHSYYNERIYIFDMDKYDSNYGLSEYSELLMA